MRITTFDYIDRAVERLDKDRDLFKRAAGELIRYLETTFESDDEIVGVTERTKTAASLREKIIRNDLYKTCKAED